MKCLFTNIQKQWNMLKSSLLFKKNANFTAGNFRMFRFKDAKSSGYCFYMELSIVKSSNLH